MTWLSLTLGMGAVLAATGWIDGSVFFTCCAWLDSSFLCTQIVFSVHEFLMLSRFSHPEPLQPSAPVVHAGLKVRKHVG